MRARKYLLPLLAFGLTVAPAAAQTGSDGLPPPPTAAPEPPATGTAARVNDQAIPEAAVRRGLRRVPPSRLATARPAMVDFLIEKALVDQYLAQLKVEPDKKEVDGRVEKIYAEIKKGNGKVEDLLHDLMMTEAEFRAEIEGDVRWDKFVNDQATDEKLQKFFEGNRAMFDGSQVRARHILFSPSTDDAAAVEKVMARLQEIKKKVEEAGKTAMNGLPPNADDFTRKTTYNEGVELAFSEQARQCSSCPTRVAGGNLPWFERTGGQMVESFAKAAFALEPFQMSDVVKTQIGYHLILVTERRPGREVKFDDARSRVKEVYADRLREAVVAAMRPRAKIEITPAPKAGQ
jgi:parvulin-like peptidyl-prolyl isomerase